jgi:hypothetical protein
MQNKNKVLLGLAALVLILGGLSVSSVARAGQAFWDRAADAFGINLSNRAQLPPELSGQEAQPQQEERTGAAGDINQSPRMIVKSRTSGTVTTTVQLPAYPVVIDRVFFSAQGDGTTQTTSIHMGLGTVSGVVATDLSVSTTFGGGSAYTYVATSTFPTVSQRYPATSSYVMCFSSDGTAATAPSSTSGICGVEFWPL